MNSSGDYEVHMVSFQNKKDGSCNVIVGKNNVQPWHIPKLEKYLAELKEALEPKPLRTGHDLC